jgi:uncharacterized protein YutD
MSDKKRRLFRLIESYINDFHEESLNKFYGNGTKIKIHSMSESVTQKTVLFEVVIVLGETINETMLNRELADVLVQDALVYFFPDLHIKTMVRWDS